jgi:hypothetical protein
MVVPPKRAAAVVIFMRVWPVRRQNKKGEAGLMGRGPFNALKKEMLTLDIRSFA